MCRCVTEMPETSKEKISMFSHVNKEQVICMADVSNIYRVPLILHKYNLAQYFVERLLLKNLPSNNLNISSITDRNSNLLMQQWTELADTLDKILFFYYLYAHLYFSINLI